MGLFDSIFGGVTNLVSGFFGADVTSTNRDIAEESNRYNAQEAQRNRDFQDWQRRLTSQDEDTKYWNRLADERAYNAPAAQAQRLRDAGINPAIMSGSAASDSTFSSPSPTAVPSGSQAQAVQPPYVGMTAPNAAVMMSTIGEFINNVSNSNLSDAQRNSIETLLSDKLLSQQLDNTLKSLQIVYEDKTMDDRVKQVTQNLANNIMRYTLLGSEVDLNKSIKELNEVAKDLKGKELEYVTKSMQDVLLYMKLRNTNLESQTNVNIGQLGVQKSQQAVNYSQASLNKAFANTENALRSGRVEFQSLQNDVLTIDKYAAGLNYQVNEATVQFRIIQIAEAAKQAGLVTEQSVEQLKQLKIRTDWEGRQQFADYCGKFVGAFSSALNAVSSARGVELRNMREADKVKVRQNFVDAYEDAHSRGVSGSSVDFEFPWARVPNGM